MSVETRHLPRSTELRIRQLLRLREEHLLQADALSLAIEREVEKVVGASLDQENWELVLEEGQLEKVILREERQDAGPDAE